MLWRALIAVRVFLFRYSIFFLNTSNQEKDYRLISKHPMNLKTLAAYFDISRPAIFRQVKILDECGLV